MRGRRISPSTILSDSQVGEVVRGIRAVFGESFAALADSRGIDLSESVRIGSLARRCKERRIELGRTIRQVALHLQVPQYRLKDIEAGRSRGIKPEALRAYVSHLGLEVWFRRWRKANPEIAARLNPKFHA